MNHILTGSIKWSDLLNIICKNTTLCFSYVKTKAFFLEELKARLKQDKKATHLIIGFDKANIHLVGLMMDSNLLIECIQMFLLP